MATHEIKTLQFASGVAIDPAVPIPTGNKLEELDDTTLLVSPPNDGDILIYNSSNQKWEAGPTPASKNIGTFGDYLFGSATGINNSTISTITLTSDALVMVTCKAGRGSPGDSMTTTGILNIAFERSPSGAGTWTTINTAQDMRQSGSTSITIPCTSFFEFDSPGVGAWDYRVRFNGLVGTYTVAGLIQAIQV